MTKLLFALGFLALLVVTDFAAFRHVQSQPVVNVQYWHTRRLTDGRVRVLCDNGGDATVRPDTQFGSLVIDCGTRE